MVRVNKTQFPVKLRREARERLRRLLHGTASGEELFRTLAQILTPMELLLIEKRLAIPILLARGMSYREIGRTIDVGPAAISFVKHHLTRKPRVPRRYDALPPIRRSKEHWMEKQKRGKKQYYMGVRVVW
ncbi:MAG: helix-turn-helix domain-containing protein [Candidatus Brennerbacteria bacterium]|nr:helix-turn-helix domain-containing protein [Candidatus Brennerbacteria bacterium]